MGEFAGCLSPLTPRRMRHLLTRSFASRISSWSPRTHVSDKALSRGAISWASQSCRSRRSAGLRNLSATSNPSPSPERNFAVSPTARARPATRMERDKSSVIKAPSVVRAAARSRSQCWKPTTPREANAVSADAPSAAMAVHASLLTMSRYNPTGTVRMFLARRPWASWPGLAQP